ncbi:hypothetical protein NBRC116494_06840 [Aurantivibrio plasticivorans]
MNEKTKNKPLTEQERQTQPLPNEVDPKDARMKVFMAAQKTKSKFKIKK